MGEEVERGGHDGSRAVLPEAAQAVNHATVLGERESLARDRWPCEVAAQAPAPGVIAGLECDLGLQREAVERGAQLAGQGERPCVAAVGAGLATLGLYAPALDRGGVELGEQRLLGLRLLDLLRSASQSGSTPRRPAPRS